ncbi:hypothetical protein DSO57_1009222 [Entomophthora muscae]|uniref:Uncharacterized protein n=1 Tax=Entomophthora muscae TaxID=34485 RepID=A0ACC2THZ6_9FUNG|nr:hypothetical protein DSO57_1009222 [Entomophthora muscae]
MPCFITVYSNKAQSLLVRSGHLGLPVAFSVQLIPLGLPGIVSGSLLGAEKRCFPVARSMAGPYRLLQILAASVRATNPCPLGVLHPVHL